MGAVANITEFGNSIHITDVLADIIAPALVKSTCMMNLMHTESLPRGTMTKVFPKSGTLTAAALVESTALQPDSNGELTDTSASCLIAKCAVSSGLSIELQEFGNISLDRVAAEQASAIARFVDSDALTDFSDLSTGVTSASVLTVDDLMLGQFNIYNSECPNKEVTLQAVLSHRGHYNIKKELVQAGASVWTNQNFLDILQRNPQPNCYVGSIPGLCDVYATSGHGTSGGDTVQAIFHPMWAYAGCFAPAPQSWVENKGPEGIYTSIITWFFYDIIEYNDLCGVKLLSDT